MTAISSCSSEEPANDANAEGPVVFNLRLPAAASSRAEGDAAQTLGDVVRGKVDIVQYAIYEVGTDGTTYTWVADGEVTGAFDNGTTTSTTVPVDFAKGRKYIVSFFASSSESQAYDFNEGKLSVNYSKMVTNNVNDDAFAGVSTVVDGSIGATEEVSLSRPFGQLNWGTNDLNNATVTAALGTSALTAQVTVSGSIYDTFDIVNNTKTNSGNSTSVEFAAVNVPTGENSLAFPVEGYDLVAMNFVMADAADLTATVTFNQSFGDQQVTSVPMNANQRTNIYGALLTNAGDFTVTLSNFNETDQNVQLPVETAPKFDPEVTEEVTPVNGVYTIENPAQYNYVLQNLKQADYRSGLTINVMTDMDFTGADYTPVTFKSNSDTGYSLTFDFNGHTIHGLTTPLFNWVNGVVKNLNIEGSNVSTTNDSSNYMGLVANRMYGTLDNVTVSNSVLNLVDVTDGKSAGGLVGFYASGNSKDCTVKNVTINNATSGWKVGGMFGTMNADGPANRSLTNCTAIDVTITDYTGSYGGAILGRAVDITLTMTGCSETGCTPSKLYGVTVNSTVTEN